MRFLGDHENPGEASIHVLAGRVRMSARRVLHWEGRHGDLLLVPGSSHSLEALEDAAVLLTGRQAAMITIPLERDLRG